MTIRTAFEIALLVLSLTLPLMFATLGFLKLSREWRSRRYDQLVEETRPLVMAALDAPTSIDLSGRHGAAAETIAASLLPQLRGADRDNLANLLEQGGMLPQARQGLRSRRAARRQRSAELLGAAGNRRAAAGLAKMLDDRDGEVRQTAARALGRIGDPLSVPPLLDALDRKRVSAHTVSMALLRIGSAGAGELTIALASDSPRVRAVAADTTGALGLIAAVPTLEDLLTDENHTTRISAVRALGRLGVPTATPTLIRRLQHELVVPSLTFDDDYARALITSLGQIGERSAIPVLEQSLMRSYRLSSAAADALSEMGARRAQHSNHESLDSEDRRKSDSVPSEMSGETRDGVASTVAQSRTPQGNNLS